MLILYLHTFVVFIFNILIVLVNLSKADVFASVAQMEPLLYIEREMSDLVENYIEAEQLRLKEIRIKAKELLLKNIMKSENPEKFLGNPLNIFHLIRKYSLDMKYILQKMNSTDMNAFTKGVPSNGISIILPNKQDLKQVVYGLLRLIETYNISISSIIKGHIAPNITSLFTMSAYDLYQIGNQLYSVHKFKKALPWFEAAIDVLNKEPNPTIDRLTLIDWMAYSYFKVKNYTRAVELGEESVKIKPTNKRLKTNLLLYKVYLKDYKNVTKEEEIFLDDWDIVEETYKKLCRNVNMKKSKKPSSFKCYYSSRTPFLTLQPGKVEVIHENPVLVRFHDVINDNEFEIIKKLSYPKLLRSQFSEQRDKQKNIDYRVSKVAWLSDKESHVVQYLTYRLEGLTGLNVQSFSELLQINNYGIGGQYDPHLDHKDSKETQVVYKHYRIATVLIYLNNVLAGGYTVFPRLNISIIPEKGSAVFWYNTYKTGEGNNQTLHGSCPVLAGTKWVANKWIHFNGQTFIKPCGLHKEDIHHSFTA